MRLRCPYCGQETSPDPKNESKSLCLTCKKRFDDRELAKYWKKKTGGIKAVKVEGGTTAPGQVKRAPNAKQEKVAPRKSDAVRVNAVDRHKIGDANNARGGFPSSVNETQTANPQGASAYSPQTSSPIADPSDTYDPSEIYGDTPQIKKQKRWAAAACVLGIFSLVNSQIPLIWEICAVVGIIAAGLGFWRLSKAQSLKGKGKALSVAGIVTGAIGCALSIAIATSVLPSVLSFTPLAEEEGTLSSGSSLVAGTLSGQSGTGKHSQIWEDLEFTIGNDNYSLMKSSVKDLSQSGWMLDLAAAGYDSGYAVEPNQMISIVELTGGQEGEHLVVNAANFDEETCDLNDCILTKIEYGTTGAGTLYIDGITCGDDWSHAQDVFGMPGELIDANGNKDAVYESKDYSRSMVIEYAENDKRIGSLSLSSLEY